MPGISFGITTSGTNDAMVNAVIDSIEAQQIPEYEVILVGGESTTIQRPNVRHVQFDESTWAHLTIHGHPGRWTTRKKNLSVQHAKYDLCVVMHDYIRINPGWYKAVEEFGYDWDFCFHNTLLSNGERGDAWRIFKFPGLPNFLMVPYDIDFFLPYMAMQGNFWIAKKSAMLEYPLNENLLWGMEDDAEWSRRVVPNCKIKMNGNAVVQYLKPRPDDRNHTTDRQTMESLNEYWNAIRTWQFKHYKLQGEQ